MPDAERPDFVFSRLRGLAFLLLAGVVGVAATVLGGVVTQSSSGTVEIIGAAHAHGDTRDAGLARVPAAVVVGIEVDRAEYRFVSAKGEFVRLPVIVDAPLETRLQEAVQRVADGVGSGVFVAEPGGGKSRLVLEALRADDLAPWWSTSRTQPPS